MPLYRRDTAAAAITDRPPDSGTDREELPSRSIGDTNGNTEDSRDHPAELVLLQRQHSQRRVQPADGTAEDGDQTGDAGGEGCDAHQQHGPEVDARESRAERLVGQRQQYQHEDD